MNLLKAKNEALARPEIICSQCGDAQESEARAGEKFSLRAVQNVLLKCRHSTGKYHTRDAKTKWLAERCNRKLLETARCLLKTDQDDVGSSDSLRNKDQEFG